MERLVFLSIQTRRHIIGVTIAMHTSQKTAAIKTLETNYLFVILLQANFIGVMNVRRSFQKIADTKTLVT